jgi:predicted alpha/beta-hydrolase family hydrolase
MRILERTIDLGADGRISSLWGLPPGAGAGAMVLAHRAGNDMHSPFLSAIHPGLAERGLLSVEFNFPYAEQGRRAQDRMPRPAKPDRGRRPLVPLSETAWPR